MRVVIRGADMGGVDPDPDLKKKIKKNIERKLDCVSV